MSELLTAAGYEQTKEKLRDLETRLAEIENRTDLDAEHLASVRRSYKMMMREYLQDIKLYEARQAKQPPMAQTSSGDAAMNSEQRRALLMALAELGQCYPEWRLGQLVANVAGWADQEVWDVEDDQLLAAAQAHLQQRVIPTGNHSAQEARSGESER